jgi:hypothetical protein
MCCLFKSSPDVKINILQFIIKKYNEIHENKHLNIVKTKILLDAYLSKNTKIKKIVANEFNGQTLGGEDLVESTNKNEHKLAFQAIINKEFNKTHNYYVLEYDDTTQEHYILDINGKKYLINYDKSIIPCIESGAGGHVGDFINIVYIEDLNKINITEIFCGKRIDHENPNEFLFYKYIYNHQTEYENFTKFICAYKGVVKYTQKKVIDGVTKSYKNEFMIIENAKKSVKNAITIDFKVGSTTYRYGENNSEFKDKSNSVLKIFTQGSLNAITMSKTIYSRIEGITGIKNAIIDPKLSGKRSDKLKTNLDAFLGSITNVPYRSIIRTLLSAKSFKIPICSSDLPLIKTKKCKKTRKMRTHPLKLLDILYKNTNTNTNINNDVLLGFKLALHKIITEFINPNYDKIKNSGNYFSFVGSSLLFVIGNDPVNTTKKIGDIKLIDFGHPVNLFMEHIKLDEDKQQLVIKSTIDYSIGILNLYFIISYFLYTKILDGDLHKLQNSGEKLISELFSELNTIIKIYDKIYKHKVNNKIL